MDQIYTGATDGRLRLSAWVDLPTLFPPATNKTDVSYIEKRSGLLDDVSLLATILNDKNMGVGWDPSLGGDDAQRKAFIDTVVTACHKGKMQCFVGYGTYKGEPLDAFTTWLNAPATSEADAEENHPTIDGFAERVVKFFKDHFYNADDPSDPKNADGLSFDVEFDIKGFKQMIANSGESEDAALLRIGKNLTDFYQAIAKKLAGTDHILAVTGGGKVDEFHWRPGKRLGVHSAIVHQYRVARDHPNILFRPMAYDAPPKNDDLFAWHKEVITYATQEGVNADRVDRILGIFGVPQFQLGVKTIKNIEKDPNDPNKIRDKHDSNGNPIPFNGNLANHRDWLHDAQRYPLLLREWGSGLCVFGGVSVSDWKKINKAVNGDLEPGKIDSPIHVPLTKTMVERIIRA